MAGFVDKNNKAISYGAVTTSEKDDRRFRLDVDTIRSMNFDTERMAQRRSIVGILFIMLGSLSISIMYLLVKLMSGTANSFILIFYRSLVQIVISLSVLYRTGEHPLGQKGQEGEWTRAWLLVRGGFGASAVVCWFFGIQHLPLPDAVTVQFTTPAFAAAFAVCLVHEEWTRLNMIGAVVCLAGVVLIAHPSWLFGGQEGEDGAENGDENDNNPFMKAIAVIITTLGSALAGLAYMSVRCIGDKASATVMVLYFATMSIPIVWLGSRVLLGTWSVWGDGSFTAMDYVLLVMIGLGGYFGQYFTNLGMQRETAATGTLVTSTQIVWTYIFELALHERINGWSMVGTGLILGFMLIVGYTKISEAYETRETVAGEMDASAMLFASEKNIGRDFIAAIVAEAEAEEAAEAAAGRA